MQAGFGVVLLAGEAEVDGELAAVQVGVVVGLAFAEGVVEDRPVPEQGRGGELLVGDFAWATQVIGLDEIQGLVDQQADRQVVQPQELLVLASQ